MKEFVKEHAELREEYVGERKRQREVVRDKCCEIMEKRSNKSRKYALLEGRYSCGMSLCC